MSFQERGDPDPRIKIDSRVRFDPKNLLETDPSLEGAIGKVGTVRKILGDLAQVELDGLFLITDFTYLEGGNEMRHPTEQELRDPNSPIRFALWGGHLFDGDTQRNLLIHFIREKGLEDDCVKFIESVRKAQDNED